MPVTSSDLVERATHGDPAAQVELAEHLDEQGDHAQAIDWLARAAGRQHPEALYVLGVRLLTGDKAPHLPPQAVSMLRDAALAGSEPAAKLSAVLAAAGIHRPLDWTEALEWLALGANRGCDDAVEQWTLITGQAPSLDHKVSAEDVALAEWLTPAISLPLHEAPRMFAVEGLIPPAICRWLIEGARGRLRPARIFENASGETTRSDLRTNMVARFGMLDVSLLHILVQARIAAVAGTPPDHLEAFSVLNYTVGQEAKEHADYIDPAARGAAEQIARFGQRVATALVYLNDDYTGGETAFPRLGIMHRGRIGDALVFYGTDSDGRPDPQSIHAGRAPLSGEKWVLSQFIRNRKMIPG